MIKKIHPKATESIALEFSLDIESPTKSVFIEDSTHYNLNSKGFRSPEFGPRELLAVGCSQTVGLGVDEEDIWPSLVSDLTGMSYANLGIVGNSAQGMFENVVAYVKLYGVPKVICALYPGMYRFKTMLRKDANIALYHDKPKDLEVKNVNLSFASEGLEIEKSVQYAKRPFNLNDVLAYEVGLYQSLSAVNSLIEFCNVADIKLVFSTWEPDATKILKGIKNFYELENVNEFFYNPKNMSCHSRMLNETKDVGRDSSGHMGSHQHLHYAELFERSIRGHLPKSI